MMEYSSRPHGSRIGTDVRAPKKVLRGLGIVKHKDWEGDIPELVSR
jgi:hypothetical protein